MNNKKILVLGGKGKTGRKVAQKLADQNYYVRIGSRSGNPSFDWEDPTTWNAVLEGIDAVYITFQPDLAVPGAVETITTFTNKVVESGVKKLVLLSGRGEKEAEECEKIVMKARANWTIVRADWFHQNFSESFLLEPIQMGHVVLPRNETSVAFVDTDDIADVVVASLLDDVHNGKIYELTGPELITFQDAVSEIAKFTDKDIKFTGVTIDEYAKMLKGYGIPESYVWLVTYLFEEVLDGRNETLTNDVEKVLGRKAKSFSDYVKETAESGIWKENIAQIL